MEEPAQTKTSNATEPSEENPIEKVEKEDVASTSVSNESKVEPMDVDTSTKIEQPETSKPVELVSPSKPIESLLPAPIVSVESAPTKIIEQPIVHESSGVSAAADTTTTTTIVTDSKSSVNESSQNNTNNDQPIELHSSPSDDDSKGPIVTNSQQATISQPDAIVELESSSNEGDTKDEVVVKTNESDSLDLELINSDSSNSTNEVQNAEIPTSQSVEVQSVPTSTVEPDVNEVTEVTEIANEPVNNNANNNNTNANTTVHSSDTPPNSIPSTNNQQPIEVPDKLCTTITGTLFSQSLFLFLHFMSDYHIFDKNQLNLNTENNLI